MKEKPPNVQDFVDKLNDLLCEEEEKVSNRTMVRPYQRMADRKLLKMYVANWDTVEEQLTEEGSLQADELSLRGYNTTDIDDLKKRLEK